MKRTEPPLGRDLVLVGGGHAHVIVLRKLAMKPLAGVRVTIISRELQSPYSGMLPGYIAGHYSFDEAHIDLGPLARFAGARFFHDEVIGLDPVKRRLLCRERPDISYDVLSIDIGCAPKTSNIPGAATKVIPVKPIDGFLANWESCLERIVAAAGTTKVAVVGAGAGGVELILAIHHRLQNEAASRQGTGTKVDLHLFTDTEEVLPGYPGMVRGRFRRILEGRGIQVHAGHEVVEVVEVGEKQLRCSNGSSFAMDEIFMVTPAAAPGWLADAGLAVSAGGFISVNDRLESVSHPGIFAAGDIAEQRDHRRPKSGVFAVRQGPVLYANLARKVSDRPLKRHVPQKHFLSLISTGNRYAVAAKYGLAVAGPLIWRWKDWIDRRFVQRFNELPRMDKTTQSADPTLAVPAGLSLDSDDMRCGGCGSKVGASILAEVLSQLQVCQREDVLIGLDSPDDAALVSVPADRLLLQSVDFFRNFVDDPYLFGQIAANHALSDIYAMGGEAQTALAIATVPNGEPGKVREELLQMMLGAVKALNAAGAVLAGGHTAEGQELALGFAVSGLVERDRVLRKSGMQAGDSLILVKPLGTGTLFAADMRHRAKGRWIAAALACMLQSNRAAADCAFAHGATACTDITGFGLLGHLLEMMKTSPLKVELALQKIPCIDGALGTLGAGIFSSLHPQNLQFAGALGNTDAVTNDARYHLLFDPQTAGGLLLSVPGSRGEDCVAALKALAYTDAAIIGKVLPDTGQAASVSLLA